MHEVSVVGTSGIWILGMYWTGPSKIEPKVSSEPCINGNHLPTGNGPSFACTALVRGGTRGYPGLVGRLASRPPSRPGSAMMLGIRCRQAWSPSGVVRFLVWCTVLRTAGPAPAPEPRRGRCPLSPAADPPHVWRISPLQLKTFRGNTGAK